MNTTIIDNRIKEIENKKMKELNKLNLEIKATNLTGLECSSIDENWIVFNPENKEQIKTILNNFKPSSKNYFLTFAGKKPIETKSPFLLCIGNFKHVKNDRFIKSTLKYKTDKGLNIWIDLNKNLVNLKCTYKQVNINSKSKNPEMYAFFSLNNSDLDLQSYYGGSLTYHGVKEKFINLLFN